MDAAVFVQRYAAALRGWLEGRREPALVEAYALGREALAAALSPTRMLELHHSAIAAAAGAFPDSEIAAAAGSLGAELFSALDAEFTRLRDYQDDQIVLNRRLREQAQRLDRTNEQLRRATDEAREATRAKAQFLANMSHEIRTPMNAVIGMTSLLLDSTLTSEQREYVEVIRSGGDHLLNVINEILDFSKIESGKLEIERENVDVRQVMEEALDLVAAKAAQKQIELAYFLDPSAPEAVLSDSGRLRQVLLNLLGNAVKFTEEGEVYLHASASPRDGRYELKFAVRDTGVGISADALPRLFRVFEQADTSTTRRFGGTGLGLAISRKLAQMMGGDAWAESTPGKGSTFYVTILADRTRAKAKTARAATSLAGKRVLILDDTTTNRKILRAYVTDWGMQPIEATRPTDALALLEGGAQFDVALVDYHMPDMDGVEFQKLAAKRWKLMSVLTGSSSFSKEEAKRRGVEFAGYLMKPLKPATLLKMISQVLGDVVPNTVERPADAFDSQMSKAHPLRILVAEDNPVNQMVAKLMLQKLGYIVDVAGNGKEAVEAVARQPYDLVLMDVQMPEMDGMAAARAITAAMPAAARPRIVALTAGVLEEERAACLAAGMGNFLPKPITLQNLVWVLRRTTPVDPAAREQAGVPDAAPAAAEPALPEDDARRVARSLKLDGVARAERRVQCAPFLSTLSAKTRGLRRAADLGRWADGVREANALRATCYEAGAVDLARELEPFAEMQEDAFLSNAVERAASVQRLADALRDALVRA